MKASTTFDPSALPRDTDLSAALRLVSRHWFLAYSKLMSLQWEWSDAIPYGATDGQRILLNQGGILKLTRQPNSVGLIAFLLVHEAMHALLGHGWRLAPMKDRKTANIAADYVINAMIKARNRELGREVFPFIDGVLIDEQLSGDLSSEQLYHQLIQPSPQPQPQPQPTQDNEPEQNTDATDEDGNDDDRGNDSEGAPEEHQEREEEDGSSDAPVETIPEDSRASEDEGPSSDDLSDFVGTGADDNLKPESKPDETEAETIERIEEDNDRVLLANAIDSKQSGDKGTTGQRLAGQRQRHSALSWPEMLRDWLTANSRTGWDSPFNAAIHSASGLIGAGRRSRSANDIVLVLDTSGSIGQETYDAFLGEAQAILDMLKPQRLHLLSVSHVLCEVVTLEAGDYVPTKLKGGGGTLFQPAFDWVRDREIEPDVLVYLTDGYSWDLPNLAPVDYPVLWLSTQRPVKDYPIGDVIEVPSL